MNRNYNNGGYNMGTTYAQQPQQPLVMNQLLEENEIADLRKTGPKFNFKLNREEYLRAICTHKDPKSGNFSLNKNGDGTRTCWICDETFTLIEPRKLDRGAIEDICANFNDIFQSIKTMYGPIPAESGREFYTMVGFINRIPDLYDIAAEYFSRLQGAGVGVQDNRSPWGMDMLNSMMNTGYPMGGMNTMGAPASFNPMHDPNYIAFLQQQQAQQQHQNGQGNMHVQQAPTQQGGMYNPGVPNPAYAPAPNPNAGFNPNAMGYVEHSQTVQAGPGGQNQTPPPAQPNISNGFKAL